MSTSQASPPRQDSLSDQMADLLRYAVSSGCYDAHDWIVARWGTRDGICGHAAPKVVGAPEVYLCHLTAGHRGAHSDCDGQFPMYWIEADSQGSPT